MKKVLIIMCAAILFLTPAFAEDYDFSEKKLDELIMLRSRIDEEITTRIGTNNSMIYMGSYLVGTDIKAGRYLITCTKENENATNGMVIVVFRSDEAYEANYPTSYVYGDYRDNADVFIGIDEGESALLSIQDGDHLVINWGQGTCIPYQAPSWQP